MNVIDERLDDAEWLQEQVDDGKSAVDIGRDIDVNKYRVRDHLYRCDIDYNRQLGRGSHPRLQDEQWVKDALERHEKLLGVAREVGVSENTARRWTVRHGIDLTEYLDYYQDEDTDIDYGSLDSSIYQPNAAWRDKDQLWTAYWEYFWSAEEIGDWVGVSGGVVRRQMKNHGIPSRNLSQSQRVRNLRDGDATLLRITEEIDVPPYPEDDDTSVEREEIETDVEDFGTLVAGD